MIEYIESSKAPRALGAYSQGIKCNELLYTSGQIAINPQTQELISGGIEEQTKLVIENISAILKAGNTSLSKVIKTTIFLRDINDFSIVNQIYSKYFTSSPARSTVEVSGLPKGALIEIECIAEA